jgi:FKBP-type peptidyl-prolyl cis-trans isomerase FklB
MSEKFKTMDERASYGIGRQIGDQLGSQPFDGMQISAVIEGISDVLEGRESQLSDADLKAAIDNLNSQIQKKQEQQAGEHAEDGEKFLQENAKRDEVTVTASGLQYEIQHEGDGDGEKPAASSTVTVHYHGTLIDGTVFDSSVQRGETIEFPVNGVIKGWTEALQLMGVGSKWKLYIPHELAYGANGAGGMIGPYATLVFEVELLAFV